MSTRFIPFFTVVVIVVFPCFFLFADSLPGAGELHNTNWKMTAGDVVAALPADMLANADISPELISFARFYPDGAVMSDGTRYRFSEAGSLAEVAITRLFNLEAQNGPRIFREFMTTVTARYAEGLGKADVDEVKYAGTVESGLSMGTIKWTAGGTRTFQPEIQVEITVLASGTLVSYTETCTNTAVR